MVLAADGVCRRVAGGDHSGPSRVRAVGVYVSSAGVWRCLGMRDPDAIDDVSCLLQTHSLRDDCLTAKPGLRRGACGATRDGCHRETGAPPRRVNRECGREEAAAQIAGDLANDRAAQVCVGALWTRADGRVIVSGARAARRARSAASERDDLYCICGRGASMDRLRQEEWLGGVAPIVDVRSPAPCSAGDP